MKDAGNCDIHWIIHFNDNRPKIITNFSHLEKPKKNIPFSSYEFQSKQEAIESLDDIVKACRELKGDCMEKIAHLQDESPEMQIKEASSNFNKLLSLFAGLMKVLNFLKKKRENGSSSEEG